MRSNPEIEISVSSPEYAWIRLHGAAIFREQHGCQGDVIQNPIVKSQYGEATNPIFEVFYVEDAHGSIADFSGNPPYGLIPVAKPRFRRRERTVGRSGA